jgi:hypothetical protein
MVVALVRPLPAIPLRQLDAVAFEPVHRPDMHVIRSDYFHVLPDGTCIDHGPSPAFELVRLRSGSKMHHHLAIATSAPKDEVASPSARRSRICHEPCKKGLELNSDLIVNQLPIVVERTLRPRDEKASVVPKVGA